MKHKLLAGLIVAGLLMGAAVTSLAQNGPKAGCNGKGYGCPPQSQQERAARQTACLEKNGGVCPNGGPRLECQGGGKGQCNGKGNGRRNGLRDGTGPRAAQGTCTLNPQDKAQK